jgi:trehalose/maltose hydrolase-like predicted phosphorylase
MSAVLGFGGLSSDGDMLKIKPSLPSKWSSIAYRVSHRGQNYRVEATHREVTITASPDNKTASRLEVAGKPMQIAAGKSETARW